MQLNIDPSFRRRLHKRFDQYKLEVGILDDGPHFEALPFKQGTSSLAGAPIRKKTSKRSGLSISDVSAAIRKFLGQNYLTEPFKHRSPALEAFSDAFLRMVFGRGSKRAVENALQAVVRNPILNQQYGHNSGVTAAIKGFNSLLIDTGQFFKAIKAKCTVRGQRG